MTRKIFHYTFSRPEEIFELAWRLTAHFSQQPDVLAGVYELLFNALEHGNLGISKQQKRNLLQHGMFSKEMEILIADPKNVGKIVDVTVEETPDACHLTIRDRGNGFNWRDYFGAIPDNTSITGRGLLIAMECGFDHLQFNDVGNAVTCTVRKLKI